MKVHIVTHANRDAYATALQAMHRQRHKFFVEEMGWEALRSPDGLEVDEYDDRYAVYLLAMEYGAVEGSLRLLPTWRRSLLGDRFSHFVTEGDLPVGSDIWEWTRWAPGPKSRPRTLVRARRALILAALEFAISRSVDGYCAVCDVKFIGQMIELGWAPRPLGLPKAYEEGTAIAVSWPVSPDLLPVGRKVLSHPWAASVEAPASSDESAQLPAFEPELLADFVSLRSALALEEIDQTIRRHAPDRAARINLRTMAVQGRA